MLSSSTFSSPTKSASSDSETFFFLIRSGLNYLPLLLHFLLALIFLFNLCCLVSFFLGRISPLLFVCFFSLFPLTVFDFLISLGPSTSFLRVFSLLSAAASSDFGPARFL
ncbi:hypothetical protein Dimus_008213 [Dionaea muscipula]